MLFGSWRNGSGGMQCKVVLAHVPVLLVHRYFQVSQVRVKFEKLEWKYPFNAVKCLVGLPVAPAAEHAFGGASCVNRTELRLFLYFGSQAHRHGVDFPDDFLHPCTNKTELRRSHHPRMLALPADDECMKRGVQQFNSNEQHLALLLHLVLEITSRTTTGCCYSRKRAVQRACHNMPQLGAQTHFRHIV